VVLFASFVFLDTWFVPTAFVTVADPLPGTRVLTIEGDIASQLVEGDVRVSAPAFGLAGTKVNRSWSRATRNELAGTATAHARIGLGKTLFKKGCA